MKTIKTDKGEILTEAEVDFIIDAVNAYWHQADTVLQYRHLGDIERKNQLIQQEMATEIIKKLSA